MATLSVANQASVFDWASPARRTWPLLGFIALSFVLHAAGFYLFQIVYPPAASLLPATARVSLITPNSEEGRTILRWVEAEDPALTSSTIRPAEMKTVGLPIIEHVPSYIANEPTLKEPPPLTVDLSMPTSQPAGAVNIRRPQAAQKPLHLPTTIAFSSELQKLGTAVFAEPKFVSGSNDAPQAVRFRVAVGIHGEIIYCFAENSSGDRELDEQARRYLVLCRFPSGSNRNELVWGSATIEWGNDLALPRPQLNTTPTL